jgi:hypothetical protein
MKINTLFPIFIALSLTTYGQNVGIGTSSPNAALDVSATNSGILIPRVALTGTGSASPLTSPTTSTLVYNTATVSNVTPGYYYWSGTAWIRLIDNTSLGGATTVSNTSSANTLSTTVNGVTGATVPMVNSIGNTSSANTLSTTVNGVTGTGVNIINSNALGLTGNNLTATINGIGSSAQSLSGLSLSGDVTGTLAASTVAAIQGKPVSATAPTASQILQYSSGIWTPTSPGASLFTAGTGLSWSGSTLNSVWTASGSNIYNNNTANVGIGTAAPLTTADVGGNLLVRGTTTFTPATPVSAVEFAIGRQQNGTMQSGQTTADIAIQYASGGYRHFIMSRHLSGAGSNQNAIDFYLNNSNTSGGSSAPGTGNVNTMSITALGLGVNTNAPTQILDVKGVNLPPASSGTASTAIIRVENTTGNGNVLDIGNANSSPYGTWLQCTDRTSLGLVYPLALNPLGGNVGIGTSNPGEVLDVIGNPTFGTATERLSMGSSSLGFNRRVATGAIYNGSAYAYQFQHTPSATQGSDNLAVQVYNTAGTNVTAAALAINGYGNVGIGTLSPAAALDITSTTSGFLPPRMSSNPATPAQGMIYYNTSTNCLMLYNGSNWQNLYCACIPASVGSGVISYTGGNTIVTYTAVGTSTFIPSCNMSVMVLIVGGGGGGGGYISGGGGGGGVIYTSYAVSAGQTYTVTVGGGGGGGGGSGGGSNGGSSAFGAITAAGGGGGGGGEGANGLSGGSGGGGGRAGRGSVPGSGNTPATTPSQGNNGGTGGASGCTDALGVGAGGGGAGGVGGNGNTSCLAGSGGAGIANSISGSSVTYAGGGGGGAYQGTGGSGGAGGGGAGANGTGGVPVAGTNGLGGGGGAGGYPTNQSGGAGGSGIVIVAFPAN